MSELTDTLGGGGSKAFVGPSGHGSRGRFDAFGYELRPRESEGRRIAKPASLGPASVPEAPRPRGVSVVITLGLMLMWVSGCAPRFSGSRVQVAGNMALLCRHCNCYMPADADLNAGCSVCNCGYRIAKCIRGK